MPAPGDQYNSSTVANPFEEAPLRMSEYTAQEIAILQSRLDKQLGPEYISTRAGPGGNRVHYLAAEKVINLANEVFGFAGWSSQIKNVQIDYVDEASGGRISLGLSIIVRVTLRNGVFHEDIGYGQVDNARGKAAAFEKAKKEAATDAMKRALRTFGNVLGNCLYDKDYLTKVTKVKVAPSKWDAENLHRHPDYAPVKREPGNGATTAAAATTTTTTAAASNTTDVVANINTAPDLAQQQTPTTRSAQSRQELQVQQRRQQQPQQDLITNAGRNLVSPDEMDSMFQDDEDGEAMAEFEDEFDGGNLFDEISFDEGHLGTITIPPTSKPPLPPPPLAGGSNSGSTGSIASNHNSSTITTRRSALAQNIHTPRDMAPRQQPTPPPPPPPPQAQRPAQHEPPVGFITSRAAELLATNNPPNPALLPKFDPKAESPSIRKTSGVDHAKSAPVKRDSLSSSKAIAGMGVPAVINSSTAALKGPSPVTPLRPGAGQQQNQSTGANGLACTPPLGAAAAAVGAGGNNVHVTNNSYVTNPLDNPARRIGVPQSPHAVSAGNSAGLPPRSGTPYKAPTRMTDVNGGTGEVGGGASVRQVLGDMSSNRTVPATGAGSATSGIGAARRSGGVGTGLATGEGGGVKGADDLKGTMEKFDGVLEKEKENVVVNVKRRRLADV